MFTISLTRSLCSLSKECSRGEEKEGDECNMYKHLGMGIEKHERGGNYVSLLKYAVNLSSSRLNQCLQSNQWVNPKGWMNLGSSP